MRCGACDGPVVLMDHYYHEGAPENPSRVWHIVAPLYFKSNFDYTECLVGFCSAACSAEYLKENYEG